jgi:hypothetical protein
MDYSAPAIGPLRGPPGQGWGSEKPGFTRAAHFPFVPALLQSKQAFLNEKILAEEGFAD